MLGSSVKRQGKPCKGEAVSHYRRHVDRFLPLTTFGLNETALLIEAGGGSQAEGLLTAHRVNVITVHKGLEFAAQSRNVAAANQALAHSQPHIHVDHTINQIG